MRLASVTTGSVSVVVAVVGGSERRSVVVHVEDNDDDDVRESGAKAFVRVVHSKAAVTKNKYTVRNMVVGLNENVLNLDGTRYYYNPDEPHRPEEAAKKRRRHPHHHHHHQS